MMLLESVGLGELLLETAVLALQAPVAEGPIHGHPRSWSTEKFFGR